MRHLAAFSGGLIFGYHFTTNLPLAIVGAGVMIYAIFYWEKTK